jgi:hypothetical protein
VTFLLPIGLLALLALPIIIVLHLLRERRRRVVVPSLLLWQNVPRRQSAQRVRRLPLTLLLLLQLLAAALIALALGRPQIAQILGGSRQLAIVLDTSTSMAARDGGSTRFAQAQEQARAALRSLGAGDRAVLVAAGPAARVLALGTGADLPTFLAALDAQQPGGTGTDLAGALTLAEAAFEGTARREMVVLTDNGPASAVQLPASVPADLDWRQIGAAQPNRAIVALAARRWGANQQVYARVANYAPEPFSGSVTLAAGGQALGARTVTIAANGETELTWTLPAGAANLRVALDGGDGLPQDDEASVNLAQARPLAIQLVSAAPETLRRALAAVPGASVTVTAPEAYQPAAAALTVFDDFLPAAWPDGPALVVNPPADSALLPVRGGAVPAGSEPLVARGAVLDGLSLAGVDFGPLRVLDTQGFATLLEKGETPLIVRGRSGAHELAIWAFDPSAGNLATRLAFPLLVSRTVRDLTPPPLPASLLAGAPLALRPDARATELRVAGPGGAAATVAAAPQITLDQRPPPGEYAIEERTATGTLFRGTLPVNAGAAVESDLRPQPAPAVASAAPAGGVENESRADDIWPWFALGALALLMLEWGYIHR